MSLATQHNAFNWLHVDRRDNREGSVMLDGQAFWERQFIQIECTGGAYKSSCYQSNWLVKRCVDRSLLFGFIPQRPCFEKVSCGHRILGTVALVQRAIIRSVSCTCPACRTVSCWLRSSHDTAQKSIIYTLRIDFLLAPLVSSFPFQQKELGA